MSAIYPYMAMCAHPAYVLHVGDFWLHSRIEGLEMSRGIPDCLGRSFQGISESGIVQHLKLCAF